jgi:hypothetical protein
VCCPLLVGFSSSDLLLYNDVAYLDLAAVAFLLKSLYKS